MSLGVTGQRPKNQRSLVVPHPVPVVGDASLAFPHSALNRKELSGKGEGSIVAVLDGHEKGLYVALDDKQEGKWMYIPGQAEGDVGKGIPREILDMVDVEFDAFDLMLELTEQRIDTRVIETPVRLMDGSYGYRCRMTFNFAFKKKAEYLAKDEFSFYMKLINAAGSTDQYHIIDHASFTGWNTGGAVIGHVDVMNAKTNKIPVMFRTTSSSVNFFRASFSLEWTSPEPIAEG